MRFPVNEFHSRSFEELKLTQLVKLTVLTVALFVPQHPLKLQSMLLWRILLVFQASFQEREIGVEQNFLLP